jgi:two-component system sensor histidine kinase/response regulator
MVVDATALAGLSPGVVASLVTTFLEGAAPLLEMIRAAVTAGDAAALRRSAHELKGAAGALGARELWGVCAQLEQLGRAGTTDGSESLLEALEAAFQRAESALQALAARASAAPQR